MKERNESCTNHKTPDFNDTRKETNAENTELDFRYRQKTLNHYYVRMFNGVIKNTNPKDKNLLVDDKQLFDDIRPNYRSGD